MTDKKQVTKEKERLMALLDQAEVPAQKKAVLEVVIDNISWQRIKLEEAREQMLNENLVCSYNNGGGQSGERENPFFKAYVNLFRSYMLGLDKFTSYLPKDLQEEAVEDAMSALELVKNMKRGKP